MLTTLGMGLAATPLAFAATSGVKQHEAGLTSGLLNTSRMIGGTIGLAALATVATTRIAGSVQSIGLRGARSLGYTEALRVSSGVAFLSAIAALLIPAVRRPAAVPDSAAATASDSVAVAQAAPAATSGSGSGSGSASGRAHATPGSPGLVPDAAGDVRRRVVGAA
jgi:hypothetical protein